MSPLYLSNLWSQQIHLFPTINILKCWRPRDKTDEHALPSVKIRIARNTNWRLADFFSVFIVLSVWANLFSGATSLLGWAKKRIWRKSGQAERWKRTLLIFFPFARPHNRESRKELIEHDLLVYRYFLWEWNTTSLAWPSWKFAQLAPWSMWKRNIYYIYIFFNCQEKINGFELAFGSETKDRIPFFADRGKIELRSDVGRG